MYKSYIFGGILLVLSHFVQAQDTLFVCDFERGIPETFVRYDRDGNEPSRSMKRYGLENGQAWVAGAEEGVENTVAYSGSWYKEVAQSDDWMVTSAIRVTDARAILSWRACALDAEHPDGYSVYVSDKGNRPEDFTGNPVATVAAESATWQEYFISLEQYAGKDVYVAFVNNSTNCNVLMVDDIVVLTREHTFSFTNLTPEAVTTAGGVKVVGNIASSGFLPVEGYKLELTYDGQTYTIDCSSESIAPDSVVTVTFAEEMNVSLNTTEDYTLVISSMGGADADTIQGSVTCFERTVLIEEGTGTWCMWCPRGQYGLQQLHKNRPGEFVDIAVHVSDPMMVTDYAMSLYAPFFSTYGLPSCVMDRKASQVGDPYMGVEEMLDKARAQGAIGRICELRAVTSTKQDALAVNATCEFGKAIADGEYSLLFVMVEDSVTGYAQSNGYSGSTTAMGGLDLLPDPIPAGEYYFANVARAMLSGTDVQGTSLTLSSYAERHVPMDFMFIFDYPESLKGCDWDNCKIVGMIVENKTGEIVNAAEGCLDVAIGIENIESPVPVRLQANMLRAVEPIRRVEVWSLGGQLLHQAVPDTENYALPYAGQPVLVKVQTATQSVVLKCSF